MKKLLKLVIMTITAFVFCINSFAYKIDGAVESTEWQNAVYSEKLVNSDSGCKIKLLTLQYDFVKEKSQMYLAFQVSESKKTEVFSNFAIHMFLPEGQEIIVTEQETNFDNNAFDIQSAFHPSTYGFSCEMKIIFKDGLKDNFSLSLFALDSGGVRSRTYTIEIDTTVQKQDEIEDNEKLSANSDSSKKENKAKDKASKTDESNKSENSSKMEYITVALNEKKAKTSKISSISDDESVSEYEDNTTTAVFKKESQSVKNNSVKKSNVGRTIVKTLAVGVIVVTIFALVMSTRMKKENNF